ncbi:MAG: TIGR03118 family protein [Telluria sp.]
MDIKGKIVRWIKVALAGATMAIGAASCGGGGEIFLGVARFNNDSLATKFTTSILVSDVAMAPAQTHSNLVNPWGIVLDPFGFAWVANNGTNSATQYDGNGAPQTQVVEVLPGAAGDARPTGIVFNGTRDFRVEQNGSTSASTLIVAGEAGTLAGWSPISGASSAVTVFDGGAGGPVYKGLAIARFAGANHLYAADFRNNAIDVFNASFARIRTLPGRFRDPTLPGGYAPFGIQAIGERIYVAYARQAGSGPDQVAGEGLGVVNVFDTGGVFISRLVTGGALNAPWGMAQAPVNFGTFSNALLVGNFGDGKINAYNPVTGQFQGTLSRTDGSPIAIDGLWGIAFGNGINFQPANTLFFAAGPANETHGQYGRIDIQ